MEKEIKIEIVKKWLSGKGGFVGRKSRIRVDGRKWKGCNDTDFRRVKL